MPFELFEHTADLGLRVRAASREELFADAARGLFSMIVANLEDVRLVNEVHLQVEGRELDLLLFDWLSELLYTFESQRLVLASFEVRLTDTGLQAIGRGEPMDPARHQLEHEVKAITYHALCARRDGPGWMAELIVDI